MTTNDTRRTFVNHHSVDDIAKGMTNDTSAGAATMAAFSNTAFIEEALARAWQRCTERQQAEHAERLAIEARRAKTRMPGEVETGTHLVVPEGGSGMRIISPFQYESIT